MVVPFLHAVQFGVMATNVLLKVGVTYVKYLSQGAWVTENFLLISSFNKI